MPITYIEINTINATNIYVVDVCTKSEFYSKKALNWINKNTIKQKN